MALSEVNHQSVEAEFFRQEGSVAHLIREVVQNSLDATLAPGRSPAVVSIRACPASRGLPEETSQRWLVGLRDHLGQVLREEVDTTGRPMPYLAIEDSGTRGLCGSTSAARVHELTEPYEDFFYFWRNIGISGKRTGRGSWGLGKAVYAASSKIRAFYGWTTRATDRRQMLMGQCGLGIHELNHTQYDAYGYFGNFGAHGDEHFAMPLHDDATIQAFRREFGLRRGTEPGLSLVIPWPIEELCGEHIADEFAVAVLTNYAYPILAGSLQVRIESIRTSFDIRADSIESVLGLVNWNGERALRDRVERIIETSRWALSETSPIRLAREDSLRAKWDELHLPATCGPEDCRRHFNEEGRLAFEVPVLVRYSDKRSEGATFRVFLRQEDASRPNIFAFIREGLTVSEQRGPPGAGNTGLVVVERGPLAQLLRDAENPAHTRWAPNAERLKGNFIGGPDRVRLVASAPSEILRRIMGPGTEADMELLADLFPDVDLHAGRQVKNAPGRKGPPPDPRPPVSPPLPRPLRLEQSESGFEVRRTTGVALPANELLVRVAYDCEGSDPFSAWEVYDFDLGSKEIECEIVGGCILGRSGNTIRVRIDAAEFLLRVTGFETRRDLVVKHAWVDGGGE